MTGHSITRDEAEQLAESTFIKSVHFFDEVASTNDAANATHLSFDKLPALFIASTQTAGRGRGQNRWISSQGSLTFSLVVAPNAIRNDAATWPQLSLWTALGIRDGIASLTPNSDVQVKWPNDVYLHQKKVCGILSEANSAHGENRLVVGVGINVKNEVASTDNRDTANAISICEQNHQVSIAATAQIVVENIDEAWKLYANGHSLLDHWPSHCMLTGRTIRWHKSADAVKGVCLGISDDGALLLQRPGSERPTKCFGGTIEFDR